MEGVLTFNNSLIRNTFAKTFINHLNYIAMLTFLPNAAFVQFFVEGGLGGMSIITLLFAFMLFAAWKFPAWVKEIGITAFVVSILWTLLGLYQAFGAIMRAPDISPIVIFGGLRVSLISTIYGMVIYLISLIIRIIQKPRI